MLFTKYWRSCKRLTDAERSILDKDYPTAKRNLLQIKREINKIEEALKLSVGASLMATEESNQREANIMRCTGKVGEFKLLLKKYVDRIDFKDLIILSGFSEKRFLSGFGDLGMLYPYVDKSKS